MPLDEASKLRTVAGLLLDLKVEQRDARLNAVQKLPLIAETLGPERTRSELIPYLKEFMDDEDDIIAAVAEAIPKLVEVSGGPAYSHLVFEALELILTGDDNSVREKASKALETVASKLPPGGAEKYLVPLALKLSDSTWLTSRSAAASVIPIVYALVPSIQPDLRRRFGSFIKDPSPGVRRAAAHHLARLVKLSGADVALNEFLPHLKALSVEDQDSVRLLSVEPLVAVSNVIDRELNRAHVLPILKLLTSDKSWRVRYMISTHFIEIASNLPDDVRQELLPIFVKLLKDNEAEVRTAAAGKIHGFSALLDGDTVVKVIVPCAQQLATDASQYVRGALALEISGLGVLVGKDNTVQLLLPLFLQLLRDDVPEVRLNIIGKLALVNKVIGVSLLAQSLIPAIAQLSDDKRWRVRLAIIEYMPLLATQLGVDFFNEQLANLCLSWLNDSVFSIREAASTNLKKLVEVFGVEWARTEIIPKIMLMIGQPSFNYRLTTTLAITAISQVVTPEVISQDLVPPLINDLCNDTIPNVRFNACKAVESLIPILIAAGARVFVDDQIVPALQRMEGDSDKDVRFHAAQALVAASS